MSNITDGRCWKELAPDTSPPLFQNGNIVFQAHYVGWIVSGFFTLVAIIASFWLINKHLQWYTNKREQRFIVRILFMVPLYAIISFASYLYWNYATPLLLIRDCYESTVLTAFFYLLLVYISPDPDGQREIFRRQGLSREYDREARKRGEPERKWMFPFGSVKSKPPDGMYFLQLMKWGVLQYCVIRPVTTLAAVILNYIGLYCEDSYSPGWGHIYITVVVSISVSIAMYCLLQLYVPVAKELAPYKPILKLFAVKAVVFLTFWQATGLGLLSTVGLVKDTKYMTADDINNGIAAILETFEMMCFAFLHFKAFTYRPYKLEATSDSPVPVRTPRWRSLCHAMDFRETFRELWAGCMYMWYRYRGKETDVLTRRSAMMEEVFGRSRPRERRQGSVMLPGKKGVQVEVEETVDVSGERQWLGVGDDYGYGLGYIRREKSEALEDQIEKELQKRGYSIKNEPRFEQHYQNAYGEQVHERGKRSWWRSIYDRISQSGPDYDDGRLSPPPRRTSRSRHHSKNSEARPLMTYDDPPPPSVIRTYRKSRNHRRMSAGWEATLPEIRDDLVHGPETERELPPPSRVAAPVMSDVRPSGANLAVPPTVSRSDSVLGRLFPTGSRSDLSSINTGPLASSSSESHRPLEIRPPIIKGPSIVLSSDGSSASIPPRSTEGQVGESFTASARSPTQHGQAYPPMMNQHPGPQDSKPMWTTPPPLAMNPESSLHPRNTQGPGQNWDIQNQGRDINRHSPVQSPNLQSPVQPVLPDRPPPSHRPRRDQVVLPALLSCASSSTPAAGSLPGLEAPINSVASSSHPRDGRRFSVPVPFDAGEPRPYSQDATGHGVPRQGAPMSSSSDQYARVGGKQGPRPLRRYSRDRPLQSPSSRRISMPPGSLATITQERVLDNKFDIGRADPDRYSVNDINRDVHGLLSYGPHDASRAHRPPSYPPNTGAGRTRRSSRNDAYSRYPRPDSLPSSGGGSSPTLLTPSPVSQGYLSYPSSVQPARSPYKSDKNGLL